MPSPSLPPKGGAVLTGKCIALLAVLAVVLLACPLAREEQSWRIRGAALLLRTRNSPRSFGLNHEAGTPGEEVHQSPENSAFFGDGLRNSHGSAGVVRRDTQASLSGSAALWPAHQRARVLQETGVPAQAPPSAPASASHHETQGEAEALLPLHECRRFVDCLRRGDTVSGRRLSALQAPPHARASSGEGQTRNGAFRDPECAQLTYTRSPDTCWSRAEWPCFDMVAHGREEKGVSPVSKGYRKTPSDALLQALGRYRGHLRKCHSLESHEEVRDKLLAYAKNPGAFNRSESAGLTHCKYMMWGPHTDMGISNNMLSAISFFVYALLSGRVFLVSPHESSLANLFCEPFTGTSSWVFPYYEELQEALAPGPLAERARHQADCRSRQRYPRAPPYVWKRVAHDDEHSGIFCSELYTWLDGADVVAGEGNQYFASAFHFIPKFRRKLNEWFPEGDIAAAVTRVLLHPANQVWGPATAFYARQEDQQALKMGIQYRDFTPDPAQHIEECLLAPDVYVAATDKVQHDQAMPMSIVQALAKAPARASSLSSALGGALRPAPALHVYVASLRHNVTGRIVGTLQKRQVEAPVLLVTSKATDQQLFLDTSHNRQALMEQIAMGLTSDVILTSSWSTYGYMMRLFSGVPAFFLYAGCPRHQAEPCFHFPRDMGCCGSERTNATDGIVTACVDFPPGIALKGVS